MDIPLFSYILFTLGFLLFSAFISGSKKAFFALDRKEVLSLPDGKGQEALLFLSERPRRTLLTLLILHLFLQTLLVLLTLTTFPRPLPRIMALLGLLVLYLSVGRILPRALVQGRELFYIRDVAVFLKLLFHVVTPFRIVLEKLSFFLLRGSGGGELPTIQDRDFIHRVIPVPEEGAEMYEREMIQNVMEFQETLVKEVMTPRPDMFCVDLSKDVLSVMEQLRTSRYSRIPVYEGDLDHIVGILYAKDLLSLMGDADGLDRHRLKDLLHPALHIPETKRVSELLRDFKKQNVHIAMVVDEFGGVEGLVCLEDLLEEIVGELQDEADEEERPVKKISDRTCRVSAMLPLEDFNTLFQVSIDSEDYETVGGFVVDQLGHFPKWGERIRYGGLEIVVYRIRKVRILELMVTRLDPVTAGDEPSAGET